jgi:hypothetical protein
MVKGSREGILHSIQPVSIHGQITLDVRFVSPDDPDGQLRVARVGPEAVAKGLEPGDRIRVDFVMGQATAVSKAQ